MKKIILSLLIVTACQTEDNNQEKMPGGDHIIFGHFYGECAGEQCVEIYSLTDNSLYEDLKDNYPSFNHAYDGKFRLLDQSLFEKVSDLRDKIPTELLAASSTVIGGPDAGDWGGIYFEMKVDGEKRYWLIDKMDSHIPENLRPFVKEIESKIEIINE